MIKLHSQGTAPDYTEHGSVSTDCKTVGQFMTEAASIYDGGLTIKVDGCLYEFNGHPKISVTDNTPIDEITYTSAPGSITFIVKTKPKPKTVKNSGWVNVYKKAFGGYCVIGNVYGKENECQSDPTRGEVVLNADFIAVAKINWEEVTE